jgi:hypothetical protein
MIAAEEEEEEEEEKTTPNSGLAHFYNQARYGADPAPCLDRAAGDRCFLAAEEGGGRRLDRTRNKQRAQASSSHHMPVWNSPVMNHGEPLAPVKS